MIRVTQANPTTYFVLFFKKDSTMKGSKDAIGALVTISKMSVEVAKEIPVIGDMIKPLAAICEQVINICQEIKACHDTFQKLQDRIEHVCELLLKKPDGLILVLKSRPELHNTVKTSIDRLIGKYDLIRRQLLPFQNSKTFFRFFVSNASNIKKTLEEKDAEIARELERLSVDLQVANLKLQVQTFDIVTDLQDKITNKFGGQQGLLHNEAALEEVAQSIGMDLEDVRVSVRDYLEEMGQKLKEHFTYESERVKQFNSGKLEEIYQSIKELGSKFDAAQNGKTSVSQNTTFLMALDQIALRDSLYMDSSIELGNGTFANIHPGRYQGKDVAVKVVKMKIIRESEATAVQDMVREILVHHKLSVVPGIVELLGVVPGDPNEPPKVVLELAEGSLHHALYFANTHTPFCQQLCKEVGWRLDILRQIAQALVYMHRINVLHRDIKPLNILLFADRFGNHGAVAKLADFSFSRGLDAHSIGVGKAKGTPYYMAPETFNAAYSKGSDVYAMAVLMNEVLSEAVPYQDTKLGLENEYQLAKLVYDGARPTIFSKCSTDASLQLISLSNASEDGKEILYSLDNMITSGWDMLPSKRIVINDICHNLNIIQDLYHGICKYGLKRGRASIPSFSSSSSHSIKVPEFANALAPHKLVEREVKCLDSLCSFLVSDCEIAPKPARDYVKTLLLQEGVYSVDSLAVMVAPTTKEEVKAALKGIVKSQVHYSSLEKTFDKMRQSKEKARKVPIVLTNDEHILFEDLKTRLGFNDMAQVVQEQLYDLYLAMVQDSNLLSCIALWFVEHIVESEAGVYSLEKVTDALRFQELKVDFEAARAAFSAEGCGLAPDLVARSWGLFASRLSQMDEIDPPSQPSATKEWSSDFNIFESAGVDMPQHADAAFLTPIIDCFNADLIDFGAAGEASNADGWDLFDCDIQEASVPQDANDVVADSSETDLQFKLPATNELPVLSPISTISSETNPSQVKYPPADFISANIPDLPSVSILSLCFAKMDEAICGIPSSREWLVRNADVATNQDSSTGLIVVSKLCLVIAFDANKAQQRPAVIVTEGSDAEFSYLNTAFEYLSSNYKGNKEYCYVAFLMGICFYYGAGTSKQYEKAFHFFSLSAEHGIQHALYYLALLHYCGHGVEQDDAKAAELFEKVALQRLAIAEFRYGICYQEGRGILKDSTKAAQWFVKAARQGHAEAQLYLAVMHYKGDGVQPTSYVDAMYWCQKAARQNNASAQDMLGLFYQNGHGVPQDYKRAVEMYKGAALSGLDSAQVHLANMYTDGLGVLQDYKSAEEWYIKAVEQNNTEAKCSLAYLYLKVDLLQDFKKALDLFTQAASEGYASAQNNLAYMYSEGLGVTQDDRNAVIWYTKAAEQSNNSARNLLGLWYQQGRCVPKDYQKALELFTSAASDGYSLAQVNLAFMYQEGLGVRKNDEKAFEWYSQAAAQNHDSAQNIVGVWCKEGRGIPQDFKRAVKFFIQAASAGNAIAQFNLALMYIDGLGVPQDASEAVKWSRKAANQNNAAAMALLGDCYQKGRGVQTNASTALKWYILAADKNDASAQNSLGEIYRVDLDYSKAFDFFSRAAANGSAKAQTNLALMYKKGEGLPQDNAKALEWFTKAANQGDVIALNALGEYYYEIVVAPRDYAKKYAKAAEYYANAAAQGYDCAQYNLGFMYACGCGVPQDYSKAIGLMTQAAEQNHTIAQEHLGKLYLDGPAAIKDPIRGIQWLRKAADQGVAKAQYKLGVCYADGIGVAKDLDLSLDWISQAAEKGHGEAVTFLPEAMFALGVYYKNGESGKPKDRAVAKEWFRKAADLGHEEAKKELKRLSRIFF